ncbi:unnamed protein product [Hermetia illucens]|uniref:LKB1 serine/threonine kinase interacting protein 1 N-terminal domain-containing protein n=1 Tax=Hermetia illucens TaxID=343691 RepID=A0A7R8US24_HERIL|nr:serine/threonine-protein kinase 11-interacting protein isoform X3 [Hermetia illucens]CAD7085916.1 unnamed protein product [Hermetia illucens]
MDPKQISTLAKLLRDSGDKILSSEFTFTVSGHLLRALNDSFTLIADQNELCSPMSFQVVKPNNSKSGVFRDLQLIHDFVQKTLVLCVTHFPGEDNFEGTIDIGKFHSLRRLEVQKVNVKQIIGIQPMRAQLQQIVCVRSLENVEDVITYCGGDRSNGFVWNELKYADFSYNNLRAVDSSLEFAQWLQNLNLSHNQLVSVDAVKWLPNLKMLDLSFNRLVHVPTFHTEAPRRLQILILSNNFIEDLTGLSRLDALNELDVSDNCLLDHSYLLPVSTLVALRYLKLSGNPLACHPKHRQMTARYLNKNTTSTKFVLDFETLSKSEKAVVGANSMLSSRLTLTTRSSGISTPSRVSQNQTPASSVGSIRSFRFSESTTSEMTTSVTERQKKAKVRTVEIEDENPSIQAATYKEVSQPQVPEGNKDHLETKRQIDEMREKFGSGWLQNENAHMVQSVLGIKESEAAPTSRVSSQQFIDDILGSMTASALPKESSESEKEIKRSSAANMLSSTPTSNKFAQKLESNPTSPIKSGESPVASEPETVYESVATKSSEDPNETFYKSTQDDDEEPNLDHIYGIGNDEAEISEPDENEVTYIVHQSDYNDEVFLAVSDTYIKERDILTRRTKTKWSLKILESCERIKGDTIRINFDTVKKDKKERIFTVEEGLCQELEKYLRGILSKRLLSEMNQTLYKCIKCSMQFSRENTSKKSNADVICPECGSIFVVELHERPSSLTKSGSLPKYEELPVVVSNITTVPAPPPPNTTTSSSVVATASTSAVGIAPNSTAGQQSAGEKYVIEESASHSSIGSAGSLNESSSCSKITRSENSFDSNRSVAGSSTNDRDMDFNFNKNGESDIEILSNPSQSSIEVLDHAFSSRKTSEERRISRVPSLETIEDNSYTSAPGLSTLVSKETSTDFRIEITKAPETSEHPDDNKKISLGHINLTESSSSGSVTDSICTAYEQDDKNSTAVNSPDRRSLKMKSTSNGKDSKKEDSIISSMFGGLFQSTNILMSRSQKQDEITCDKFKFSYTDFSDADHRLKLHLFQNVFEDSNENFKWLVKGKIFSEVGGNVFEGVMVMSTTRFYVMEIYGPERDDISKWLKRVASVKVDRIESVELLPWKIGLSFTLKGLTTYLILLQDILRTDSLLLYFANNPLPDDCTLGYQISQKILKKIAYFTNEEQLRMVSILNRCEISSDAIQKTLSPTGFFASDTHLYLTTTNFSWLFNNSNDNLELGHVQLMSNLIEVDRPEKNVFSMNFLDEDQDKYELWKCSFETEDNAESCLNAIGQSWEKLFGVPLTSN